MFGKITQAELESEIDNLKTEIEIKDQELVKAQNHIAMLLANAKRWSRKFQNPLYSVPTKIIAQMEKETKQYKQKTRAKLDEYAAKNAVLMEKIIKLQGDQDDAFGSAAGNSDVSFDFATSHTDSHIKPEDREAVELELNDMMKERFAKHTKKPSAE